MAIPEGVKSNFETLRRAFRNGDVALMECTDKTTSTPIYVVCAVQVDRAEEHENEDDTTFNLIPFAVMDHELFHKVTPPTDVHNSLGKDA